MEPTVYRPPEDLARFVEYFWTFEWGPAHAGRTLKMFATGVSGILFQHHDGRPALGATADGRPSAEAGVQRPSCLESGLGRVRPFRGVHSA